LEKAAETWGRRDRAQNRNEDYDVLCRLTQAPEFDLKAVVIAGHATGADAHFEEPKGDLASLLDQADATTRSSSEPSARRRRAIALLRRSAWTLSRDALVKALDSADSEVQRAALQAIAAYSDEEVAAILLAPARLTQATPPM